MSKACGAKGINLTENIQGFCPSFAKYVISPYLSAKSKLTESAAISRKFVACGFPTNFSLGGHYYGRLVWIGQARSRADFGSNR